MALPNSGGGLQPPSPLDRTHMKHIRLHSYIGWGELGANAMLQVSIAFSGSLNIFRAKTAQPPVEKIAPYVYDVL